MFQKFKVVVAAGLAAAVVITSIGVDPADARTRRQRHNDAAAVAAIAGVIGTAAVLAQNDSRRDRYYDDGYRSYRGSRAYRSGTQIETIGPGQNTVNRGNGTQYYTDYPGGPRNATPLGNPQPDGR